MTIEFKLQEVSEGVESVDIAEIMVSAGDVIDAGAIVCEVETDKAVAEIECPHAGTVKEILVTEGESVAIGASLLVIEEVTLPNGTPTATEPALTGSPESSPVQPAEAAAVTDSDALPVVDFVLPEVSEGVTSVDVAEIMISVGDVIESGTVICEIETDKAVAEIECPHTGTITAVHISDGDRVEIGAPLITIKTTVPATAENDRISPAERSATVTPVPQPKSTAPVHHTHPPPSASPATRQLAENPGVPLPDFSQFGPVERQPLSNIYRSAANNLHNSWSTIPHVTQHDLTDVTELENARKHYVQSSPRSPSVTMTAIVIKAVVRALKAFPHFNSSLDMETGEWVLKRYYHIGVAVDTPKGLVVPVIYNCDQKTVVQVATELTDLANRAREYKLKSAEMCGASFTVTNLGGIGGTYFTPIVNYPQVAILGLSRCQMQLKLKDGQITERMMLPLSMSYDHRAINGADATRFIVMFSDSLTNLAEFFSPVSER